VSQQEAENTAVPLLLPSMSSTLVSFYRWKITKEAAAVIYRTGLNLEKSEETWQEVKILR